MKEEDINIKDQKRTSQLIAARLIAMMVIVLPLFAYIIGLAKTQGFLSEFNLSSELFDRGAEFYWLQVFYMFYEGGWNVVSQWDKYFLGLVLFSGVIFTAWSTNELIELAGEKRKKKKVEGGVVWVGDKKSNIPDKKVSYFEAILMRPFMAGSILFAFGYFVLVVVTIAQTRHPLIRKAVRRSRRGGRSAAVFRPNAVDSGVS